MAPPLRAPSSFPPGLPSIAGNFKPGDKGSPVCVGSRGPEDAGEQEWREEILQIGK